MYFTEKHLYIHRIHDNIDNKIKDVNIYSHLTVKMNIYAFLIQY
jgi:hypothetical protein